MSRCCCCPRLCAGRETLFLSPKVTLITVTPMQTSAARAAAEGPPRRQSLMSALVSVAQSSKAREALAAQQAIEEEEDGQSASDAQSEPPPPPYSGRACCCLEVDNPLRVRCISFIEWPWFDRFILFVIVLNSLLLAVQARRTDGGRPRRLGWRAGRGRAAHDSSPLRAGPARRLLLRRASPRRPARPRLHDHLHDRDDVSTRRDGRRGRDTHTRRALAGRRSSPSASTPRRPPTCAPGGTGSISPSS